MAIIPLYIARACFLFSEREKTPNTDRLTKTDDRLDDDCFHVEGFDKKKKRI